MVGASTALFALVAMAVFSAVGQTRPGQSISIKSQKLYIYQAGEGLPTIVIDVGIASPIGTWMPLLSNFPKNVLIRPTRFGKPSRSPVAGNIRKFVFYLVSGTPV